MLSRRKKFLIVFLSVISSLLACEYLCRRFCGIVQVVDVRFKGDLLGDRGSFKISQDPVLLYEWWNLPQQPREDKKEGVKRVLVLGDSITYRVQWTIKDYYPAILEDMLNSREGAANFEIINAGVPGYNLIQEVRYLETRWLDFKPDIVIVGYCAANDRTIKRQIKKFRDGLYCSDVAEGSTDVFGGSCSINRFLLSKSSLYRLVNSVVARIISKLEPSSSAKTVKHMDLAHETEEAIKKIKILADKQDFKLLFVVFPLLNNGSQHESDWIVDRCIKYNIAYTDLRKIFGMEGYENLIISRNDSCHPNKLGHKLAAKSIMEHFNGIQD